MPKRQMNPNSLKNLTHEGRPPAFDEPKKKRYPSVTDTGWEGSQVAAQALGYSGVSELLENLGRGKLKIEPLEAEHQET